MKIRSLLSNLSMNKEIEMKVSYIINGRKYTFVNIHMDGGVEYGYCKRIRKWGWLFPNFIQFEDGDVQLAERL